MFETENAPFIRAIAWPTSIEFMMPDLVSDLRYATTEGDTIRGT